MREMLFKGKRIDNGKWIFGDVLHNVDVTKIRECEAVGVANSFIVIPETVGQYTGLTDKNGVKIFEGDTISVPFTEDRSPYEENSIYYENARVYFDTERYGWYIKFHDDDIMSLWEYDSTGIEVIGNI